MTTFLISKKRQKEGTTALPAGRTSTTTISSLFLILFCFIGEIHPAMSYSDSMDSSSLVTGQMKNNVSAGSTYNEEISLFLMDYHRKQVEEMFEIHDGGSNDVTYKGDDVRGRFIEEEDEGFNQVQEDDYYRYYGERPIPTTMSRFVSICTGYLFGDDVTKDKKITNVEAANFFPHLCTELKKKSCQTPIKFHNLSIDIQMEFVSAVCPRIDDTSAAKDTECIKELRKQVENRNEFGFEITEENSLKTEKEIDNYCTALFSLSSDFVNPSDSPTRAPSKQPSSEPSKAPAGPLGPTASPTVSQRPSGVQVFSVSFTYMMGFSDTEVHQNVVDKGREDIMDATADAIRRVLFQRSPFFIDPNANRGRRLIEGERHLEQSPRKHLRQRQNEGQNQDIVILDFKTSKRDLQKVIFSTEGGGVEHKTTRDEECTEAFSVSTDCILMGSEVTLQSPSTVSFQQVESSVHSSIQSSMDDKQFREIMGEPEVKEVVFIKNGLPTGTGSNDIGVGGGSIAGITIGSVLFLVLLAFFVGRARARSDDDESEVDEDDLESESVYEGNSSSSSSSSNDVDDERIKYIMTAEEGEKKSRSLPAIDEDQKIGAEPRGLQFDPTSGQVVGSAARSYGSSSFASAHSGYSADNTDTTPKDLEKGDQLVNQLDAAVHAGDWGAVAAIAGDLSQADDISTMSSFYSRAGDISYDPSDRESLGVEDAERAVKIDKLIAEGDWSAVGATAAAFDSETGSASGSEKSPRKRSPPPLPPLDDESKRPRGKSLIDFISGPWQSTAAANAVSKEDEIVVPEFPVVEKKDPYETFNNNEVMSLSEPSDLSAGEAGQLAALGTVGTAGAMAAAAYHSESETTTDDDTKNLLSASQKKKRTWAGRLFKKSGKEGGSGKSLALQEDSSVSSWSRGEDSSPDTTLNLYGANTQATDDMPAEMRAFGEDHGLAAAERAMEKEEDNRQYQNINSDREGSDGGKSAESLRDELDKAIESGDWAAVEKQTNEMLDVDDVDDAEEGQRRRSLSDIDSEIDTSDGEGWSTANQSDYESEVIDDERIEMLEKLIETDDWQGIVDNSQIHNKEDNSVVVDE